MSDSINFVVEEEFKNRAIEDRISQLEELFYLVIKRTIETNM